MSKIIPYDSDEAAKFVINISGWVASNGAFYGDNEQAARYRGCTHRTCVNCDELVIKSYIYCTNCAIEHAKYIYNKRECKDWGRNFPLYSEVADKYYFDEDELLDDLEEYNCSATSLRLRLCKPIYLQQINEGYWEDDLPEDVELPKNITKALEKLNEEIRKTETIAYEPSKCAAGFLFDAEYRDEADKKYFDSSFKK